MGRQFHQSKRLPSRLSRCSSPSAPPKGLHSFGIPRNAYRSSLSPATTMGKFFFMHLRFAFFLHVFSRLPTYLLLPCISARLNELHQHLSQLQPHHLLVLAAIPEELQSNRVRVLRQHLEYRKIQYALPQPSHHTALQFVSICPHLVCFHILMFF